MSNDFKIGQTSWRVEKSCIEPASRALRALATQDPDEHDEGPAVEMLAEALEALGLQTETEPGSGDLLVVGREDLGWIRVDLYEATLLAMAPFSADGSFMEYEHEYDDHPCRWQVHQGRLHRLVPTTIWSTPCETSVVADEDATI